MRSYKSEDLGGIASVSRANQAAAFARISRSWRKRLFSLRKKSIATLVMVIYLSFMLTLRDHDSAAPSDLWIPLGAKRKQLLDRSWAGVFRDYLLLELPVGELAPHFSKDFGRPSKDLHVVLGALLLQQLHDLTDAQTVEAGYDLFLPILDSFL